MRNRYVIVKDDNVEQALRIFKRKILKRWIAKRMI